MKKNVGSIDVLIRVVIGLAIIGFAFTQEGSMRWIGLAALVPFGTAALRFCPLYTLLGISSCPTSK